MCSFTKTIILPISTALQRSKGFFEQCSKQFFALCDQTVASGGWKHPSVAWGGRGEQVFACMFKSCSCTCFHNVHQLLFPASDSTCSICSHILYLLCLLPSPVPAPISCTCSRLMHLNQLLLQQLLPSPAIEPTHAPSPTSPNHLCAPYFVFSCPLGPSSLLNLSLP